MSREDDIRLHIRQQMLGSFKHLSTRVRSRIVEHIPGRFYITFKDDNQLIALLPETNIPHEEKNK